MAQYTIRIVDEKGNLIPEEIVSLFDFNLTADKEFEVMPSLFPTTPPAEYIVRTDAEYFTVSLNLGKITIFSYSGKPKDIEIVLTSEKINSIKSLLG